MKAPFAPENTIGRSFKRLDRLLQVYDSEEDKIFCAFVTKNKVAL